MWNFPKIIIIIHLGFMIIFYIILDKYEVESQNYLEKKSNYVCVPYKHRSSSFQCGIFRHQDITNTIYRLIIILVVGRSNQVEKKIWDSSLSYISGPHRAWRKRNNSMTLGRLGQDRGWPNKFCDMAYSCSELKKKSFFFFLKRTLGWTWFNSKLRNMNVVTKKINKTSSSTKDEGNLILSIQTITCCAFHTLT